MEIKEDKNMTKRTKKFIAGLLTASMVLGSFTMVYAGTDGEEKTVDGSGFNVKGESTVNEAEIHVVVPTEVDYVVNPLGIPLEVQVGQKDLTTYANKQTVSGQIIAPVYTIENKSEVPLELYVKSVSANGGSSIDIKTSSAKKAKKKSAYLFLQLGKTDDVKELFQANRYSKMINWEKTDDKKTVYKNDDDYKKAMKAGNIVEIKVGTDAKPTTMKKPFNVKASEKVYLTINGDVNAVPTEGDPWKESDQVTLGYTLYFKPAGGAAAK
jgi:hypothetical protein